MQALGMRQGSLHVPLSTVLFFPTTTPTPLPPTKDAQWEKPGGRADKRQGLRGAAWSLSASHSSTAPRAVVPSRV